MLLLLPAMCSAETEILRVSARSCGTGCVTYHWSGVCIARQGNQSIVATVAHAFSDKLTNIRVQNEPATLIYHKLRRNVSDYWDLALLRVSASLPVAPIGADPVIGQRYCVAGFGEGTDQLTMRCGLAKPPYATIGAYSNYGDSGGVIGRYGAVSGIIAGQYGYQKTGPLSRIPAHWQNVIYTPVSNVIEAARSIGITIGQQTPVPAPIPIAPQPDPISTPIDQTRLTRIESELAALQQQQTQITEQLNLISQRLVTMQLKAGPKGDRGPAGPTGKVDTVLINSLTKRINALEQGRRVILVEGNKIIDDEIYEVGEPIILDIERIRKTGR